MKETRSNHDIDDSKERSTDIKMSSIPISSVAGKWFNGEKVLSQRRLQNLQHLQTLENAKSVFVNGCLEEQDNKENDLNNTVVKVKKL